jgi:nucleoside phosphorylase
VAHVLLVAATEIELRGHGGLACGVGPVEAAATTSRELALRAPDAVVHVGLAGGHEIALGGLVIGSASVYADLSAAIPVVNRVEPDPRLLGLVHEALRDALVLPIGTSGTVGGVVDGSLRVEAMEGFGVLRACALAGVPAVEVRAISNELGESDRARWRIPDALDALGLALPSILAAAAQ